VLRGYGGDEALVHARLNPEIPVVIEARRAEGIRRAVSIGATVAVLDDAFQHRGAGRAVDIVLISAEQWRGSPRLLPAGPWREPLAALRRASIVVITRKTADDLTVKQLTTAILGVAPLLPQAVVRFTLGNLRNARREGGESLPLNAVSGRTIVAIAGIADSGAFFEQLSDAGADVRPHSYPDHHQFTSADIVELLAGERGSQVMFVCTLKDAVKLGALWPATAPPLWYVSQALQVENGAEAIQKLLDELAPTSTKGI
jgi:tetraacyldisaccharide 4'-kinase